MHDEDLMNGDQHSARSSVDSPGTPTSVLPQLFNGKYARLGGFAKAGNATCSYLMPLRTQSLGRLNSIYAKRLSFPMFPPLSAQEPCKAAIQIEKTRKTSVDDVVMPPPTLQLPLDKLQQGVIPEILPPTPLATVSATTLPPSAKVTINTTFPPPSPTPSRTVAVNTTALAETSSQPPMTSMAKESMQRPLPPQTLQDMEVVATTSSPPVSVDADMTPPTSRLHQRVNLAILPTLPLVTVSTTMPPPSPSSKVSIDTRTALPTPSPKLAINTTTPASSPSTIKGPMPRPQPPSPTLQNIEVVAATTTPSPPLVKPMVGRLGPGPSPPLPMRPTIGGAPPPPPPGIIIKAMASKLKRSAHMGNLYRVLKGKIEGSCLTGGKSTRSKKSQKESSSGSSKSLSMSDAIAEMMKRSPHFIQIEKDIEQYGKQITELESTMTSFQTKNMPELLKFLKNVESQLEKLSDETQVLKRFKGFPIKKLEALRMAAALYLKLDGILAILTKWKVEAPLDRSLDKAESYFNKVKTDLDKLDRTKDEEFKQFKTQKINFDFNILITKIKEAMVDLSSGCMELAIKEGREAKATPTKALVATKSSFAKKKEVAGEILWKAFQFAFRVYTFAGGLDDRADKLMRELAQEREETGAH